jgi:hypothetical protein
MSSKTVCQAARSWVDVGSFHTRLVVCFMIFTASVRKYFRYFLVLRHDVDRIKILIFFTFGKIKRNENKMCALFIGASVWRVLRDSSIYWNIRTASIYTAAYFSSLSYELAVVGNDCQSANPPVLPSVRYSV